MKELEEMEDYHFKLQEIDNVFAIFLSFIVQV